MDVEMLDGMIEERDRHFVSSMRGDLMRWLEEEGQPTEGVEIIATVPLLSCGDAPEYGCVLWRDTAGEVHLWTAWQYRDLWDAAEALEVMAARAASYERMARWTRAFRELALRSLPSDGWRWLCVPCGTEGLGHEPRRCPSCSAQERFFSSNTHGGRPLKEVMLERFGKRPEGEES